MSTPDSAVHLVIQGRVQGVGFRFFTQAIAQNLALTGWVRNQPDGSVEAFAEGSRARVEMFVEQIRQGPPLSRVENVLTSWRSPLYVDSTFDIR